jgi:hypothetical protein
MFAQAHVAPPTLDTLAATPVLTSEMPPGFTHSKIVRLPAASRVHLLGGVRFDFSNAHTTESESFALFTSPAAAQALAKRASKVNGGDLFSAKAVAVGRFVIAVTATTREGASTLLSLALAHFRRVEG